MGEHGVVVRALASYHVARVRFLNSACYTGWFAVGLVLAPRGSSPGTPVFPSPQKPTFPNSNSIWNLTATGFSVETDCCVTLAKQI